MGVTFMYITFYQIRVAVSWERAKDTESDSERERERERERGREKRVNIPFKTLDTASPKHRGKVMYEYYSKIKFFKREKAKRD